MESVIVIIVVVVLTVISRVRQAQRKGRSSFKLPTPKSWQLPAPGPGNVIQPIQGNQPAPMPSYGPRQGMAPPRAGVVQPGVVPPGWVAPPVAPHLPGQAAYQTPQRLPHHRPQAHHLPLPQGELDNRVRELMASNQEVAAIRLLCDEADLGIIDAQEYARSLTVPGTTQQPVDVAASAESRYDGGSAAFGSSLFERDDENVWASGWVESPEPDDRTDVNELWRTVRDAANPAAAQPDQGRG
jgi:hypothetical protein